MRGGNEGIHPLILVLPPTWFGKALGSGGSLGGAVLPAELMAITSLSTSA